MTPRIIRTDMIAAFIAAFYYVRAISVWLDGHHMLAGVDAGVCAAFAVYAARWTRNV